MSLGLAAIIVRGKLLKLCFFRNQHAVPSLGKLSPVQRKVLEFLIESLPAVPQLKKENTVVTQVLGSSGKNLPCEIQSLNATAQSELRFYAELCRHAGEFIGVHIGRIAKNEVKARCRKSVKQI